MWSTKYPRVKEVLQIYDDEGIDGLVRYYMTPGMMIPPDSWHQRVAKSLVDGHKISLECELNLAIDKLKYKHERYTEQSIGFKGAE